MAEIVVDASILVKWYISEAHSDKALVLRDRLVNGEIELAAPSLISYETLYALKYSSLFSTSQLKDIANSIRNYGIHFYGLDAKTSELTIEASEKNGLTVYDGSYLGLAKSLSTEFITADQKLIDRLTDEYSKFTKHVRNL